MQVGVIADSLKVQLFIGFRMLSDFIVINAFKAVKQKVKDIVGLGFFWRSLELIVDKPGGFVELVDDIKEHLWDEDHDALVEFVDTIYEGDDFPENVLEELCVVVLFAYFEDLWKYLDLGDFVDVHHLDAADDVVQFVLLLLLLGQVVGWRRARGLIIRALVILLWWISHVTLSNWVYTVGRVAHC